MISETDLSTKKNALLKDFTRFNQTLYDQWEYDYERGYPSQETEKNKPDWSLTKPEPLDERKKSVMTYPITKNTKLAKLPTASNRLSDRLDRMETGDCDPTAWNKVQGLTIPVIFNHEYYYTFVHHNIETKIREITQEYWRTIPKEWSRDRRSELKKQFSQERSDRQTEVWRTFYEVKEKAEQELDQSWKASVKYPLGYAQRDKYVHSCTRALLLLPHPPSRPMLDVISRDEHQTNCDDCTTTGMSNRALNQGNSDTVENQPAAREIQGLHELASRVNYHIRLYGKEDRSKDRVDNLSRV